MKADVLPISYEETKPFILGVHYARRMPSISWAFGLFLDGVLSGVVSYGKPASPWLCVGIAGKTNAPRVYELNRLVIVPPGESPRGNLASILVGRSLRMLPSGLIVVSYADAAWGHSGSVYQATNFTYTGKTKERTDMASTAGHSRHNCGDSTQRQLRSAKHRYYFITGTRKEKKAIQKEILYPTLPYPKGATRLYDTSNPLPADLRFAHGAHRHEA